MVSQVAHRKMHLIDRLPEIDWPKLPQCGFDFLILEEAGV
jgi:hypothetical protein